MNQSVINMLLDFGVSEKTTCWIIWAVKFYLLDDCKSRFFWGGFSSLNSAAEKYTFAVDHIALRLWLTAV